MLPDWILGICAIAGALIITFILLRFSRRHLSNSRLLLAGVALGIICSALMTWAIYFQFKPRLTPVNVLDDGWFWRCRLAAMVADDNSPSGDAVAMSELCTIKLNGIG